MSKADLQILGMILCFLTMGSYQSCASLDDIHREVREIKLLLEKK